MTDKFWIGGTGTWNNTNDANWSLTSGGPNNTTHPVAGDRVFIDGNSGVGTISRLTAGITCDSLDCNGYTGTLSLGTVTTTLAVGDLRFSTGMTLTASTGAMIFTGTGTQNITSNGKTMGALTVNGTGVTVKLLDAANCGSRTFTLTKGTFDMNGFDLTAGAFSSSTVNTRTLTFGGGTFNLGGSWTTSTTTNLTITAGGRLVCTGANVFTSASGITIPAIECLGTAGVTGPTLTLDSASAFASILARSAATGGGTVQLNQAATCNGDLFIKKPTYDSGVGNVNLKTASAGVAQTFTVNGEVRLEGVDVQDITAAGSSWWARGGSTSVSGNTGINFSGAGDGADYGIMGASGVLM